MIWLALSIPILFAIIGLIYFRKRISFWEPFIPLSITIAIIILFKYIGISSLTKDTEYWGNYISSVHYYERWDEWIEQTCSRSVPCGTDSKGNTTYCTETYDCSYRDEHPEHWTMKLNGGQEIKISKSEYEYYKRSFGTKSIFVDMNRDYYRIDGDMYTNNYPNTYESFKYYATEHTYTNKIQASTSIFNYPNIKDNDILKYKLYNYPKVNNNSQYSILFPKSVYVTMDDQKRISYINGKLGSCKKVHVWVCLFDNMDEQCGYKQEAYWKGGNLNELIICIGVNKNKDIFWVHVFSWCKEKTIEIETRNFIQEQKKLNLSKLGDWLYNEVDKKWKKTSAKDFEYLSIEPPFWSILTTWIISFLSCILIYIWIYFNKFTSTDIDGDGNDNFNENDNFKFIDRIKLFCKLKK